MRVPTKWGPLADWLPGDAQRLAAAVLADALRVALTAPRPQTCARARQAESARRLLVGVGEQWQSWRRTLLAALASEDAVPKFEEALRRALGAGREARQRHAARVAQALWPANGPPP